MKLVFMGLNERILLAKKLIKIQEIDWMIEDAWIDRHSTAS